MTLKFDISRVPRGLRPASGRDVIHSVSINGYRGFSRFDLSDLGRVNLLVGRNNSGKTSVLEALYLLASGGDVGALWRILLRRGERLDLEVLPQPSAEVELDISHLFCGHELKVGATIHLSTRNGVPDRTLTYKVAEWAQSEDELSVPETSADRESVSPRLRLIISGSPKPATSVVPLTRHGGISSDALDRPRRLRRGRPTESKPSQYVATESLSVTELVTMWNDIVLTESEDLVLEALRFLEPKIERIAAVSAGYFYYGGSRGGFKVKLRGTGQPVPIGSLGDGIWRMLALAISLIRSKDGVLLIDEVDTGLHYTVMADMWRFVSKSAEAFNVQVFATTHSYDCVQSLAAICRESDGDNRISIQRIEAGKKKAIPYSESEIRVAAQQHIEIR